jgi:hypothetical protein
VYMQHPKISLVQDRTSDHVLFAYEKDIETVASSMKFCRIDFLTPSNYIHQDFFQSFRATIVSNYTPQPASSSGITLSD